MSATVSITQTDIFTVLRAFVLNLVDCEVVRGIVNRVPSPRKGFIVLSPINLTRQSTNVVLYDAATDTQSIRQSTQVTIQVDCYGVDSADWAVMIMTAFRSMYATEFFAASGFDLQPLYSSEPNQLPLVNGEQQYQERWMIQVALQSNPVTVLGQQFADSLGPVDLISIDVVYPQI